MDFEIIENMTEFQVYEMYDDIIEKEYLSWCMCCRRSPCDSSDNGRRNWSLAIGDGSPRPIHNICNYTNPWSSCSVAYYWALRYSGCSGSSNVCAEAGYPYGF